MPRRPNYWRITPKPNSLLGRFLGAIRDFLDDWYRRSP